MGRHENECVPMYIHKNEHEHVIASQGTLHIVVGDKPLDAICATAGVRFDKEERLPRFHDVRRLTLRPRAQRHLRDSTLLIATGAASSLHGHSLQDSHHVTGQVGWVSVSRKIAIPLRSLKSTTQRNFAGGAARCGFLLNGSGRIFRTPAHPGP